MNQLGKFRHGIKQLLSPIFAPFYAGIGTILMFHRVLPESNQKRVHNHLLEVSPEALEKAIIYFKERSYDFIKMADLPVYLKGKKKKKFVVFTFDDGYIDNYTHAYPIFKKHGVPFTIYITTGFPDNKIVLWQYLLEDYLRKNDAIEININGSVLKCDASDNNLKEQAFDKIRRMLIDSRTTDSKSELKRIFGWTDSDLLKPIREMAMTWEMIDELSKDDLVELGAHSKTHPSFMALNEGELTDEVIGSVNLIEQVIGRSVSHFAYPYGSKNEVAKREIGLMKKLPIKTAVSTRMANIHKAHIDHILMLPRFFVGPEIDQNQLDYYTSGKYNFITDSKNRIKTY